MINSYEKLANAVILLAVKDWRRARRKLKRKSQNESAKQELDSCERFFRSDWFEILSNVDGTFLLKKLYEESGR